MTYKRKAENGAIKQGILDALSEITPNTLTFSGWCNQVVRDYLNGVFAWDGRRNTPKGHVVGKVMDMVEDGSAFPNYSFSLYIPSDTTCWQDSTGLTAGAKDAVVGLLMDTGSSAVVPRRNLLTYTEQFDNAVWSKNNASITANAAVAPDGTLTADKLVDSASSTQHYTVQAYNFSTATAYTVSVFAKYESRRYLQIRGDYPSTTYATFDLVNGVVGLKNAAVTSSSIQSVGNGWYRCQMTFTTTGSGAGNVMFNLANADSASAVVYTGDGTSGIYIWGAQLEPGASATDYQRIVSGATGEWMPGNHATQTTAGYKPILRKGAKNLLTYSQEFDNAAWTKTNGTIAANTTVAPDGTTTMDSFFENTSNAAHYVTSNSVTVPIGTTFTFSCYVKSNGSEAIEVQIGNGSYFARYNLSTGDLISSSGILSSSISAADQHGIRRIVATATVALTSVKVLIVAAKNIDGISGIVYVGDPSSGLYLWGAQLELGSTASTYVATTSAPASNGIGPWWLDYDDTDDRLGFTSVPLAMADSGVVSTAFLPLAQGRIFSEGNTADADSQIGFGINASGYADALWKSDDGLTSTAITGSTNLIGSAKVISTRKSGNDKSLWVNSTQIGATDSTAIGTTTLNSAKTGALVGLTDSDFASGREYGLAIIPGTPTASEILTVERYLAQLAEVTL